MSELVPRAGGEAIVATIDTIAHGLAELTGDRAVMFEGEI